MDKVLLVEDNLKLQKFLWTRLQKYNKNFEAILVSNGEEAIRVLQINHISLLVADIVIPKIDCMNLLNHIRKKHPHIPCIVITAHAIPEIKEMLSDINVFCFFQKPFQLKEFTQAILQALEPDIPDGALKGISVANFLQMIQLEDKTCLIEVYSPNKIKGLFYFQEGIPYDAVYGDLKGEKAAFKIIAMDKAKIRLKNLPRKKPAKRINIELTSLIMEAMRRKDESNG